MMNGPNECKNAVINAISIGYRMIDTARSYGNEEVGEAIRESEIDKSEITVVTKLRRMHAISYESTIEHCKISLEKLAMDQIDLYLVHAPRRTERERTGLEGHGRPPRRRARENDRSQQLRSAPSAGP